MFVCTGIFLVSSSSLLLLTECFVFVSWRANVVRDRDTLLVISFVFRPTFLTSGLRHNGV